MNRRGLTVIEVLVVMGIVLIGIALLLPMIWMSQKQSRRGVF
jgi:prepilin-type N-terminal cleavage/methylation domain-containing protein